VTETGHHVHHRPRRACHRRLRGVLEPAVRRDADVERAGSDPRRVHEFEGVVGTHGERREHAPRGIVDVAGADEDVPPVRTRLDPLALSLPSSTSSGLPAAREPSFRTANVVIVASNAVT
jgi:hypothetical protein